MKVKLARAMLDNAEFLARCAREIEGDAVDTLTAMKKKLDEQDAEMQKLRLRNLELEREIKEVRTLNTGWLATLFPVVKMPDSTGAQACVEREVATLRAASVELVTLKKALPARLWRKLR